MSVVNGATAAVPLFFLGLHRETVLHCSRRVQDGGDSFEGNCLFSKNQKATAHFQAHAGLFEPIFWLLKEQREGSCLLPSAAALH